MSSPSRTVRRSRHNTWIGLASLSVGLAAWTAYDPERLRDGVSVATAYAGLGLLATSLVLGPVNQLRRRANPLSSNLRRDVGIWAACFGVTHVVVGLSVHMGGDVSRYFLSPPGSRLPIGLRLDAFGIANHLGLAGGVILLLLLLISNDRALRALGASRWKRVQRLNYACAAAVAGHGVLYQLLERRRPALVLVFAATLVFTLLLQSVGRRAYQQARGRP